MRWARTVGVALLVALVAACSKPSETPIPEIPVQSPPPVSEKPSPPVPAAPTETKEPPAKTEPTPKPKPVPIRFRLYEGAIAFRDSATVRSLAPGEAAVIGVGERALEILLPGVSETAARGAVTVKGAALAGDPIWLEDGGLSLVFGPGEEGEKITVTVNLPGTPTAKLSLARAAAAQVWIDLRFRDEWIPVTILSSYSAPGSGEVRITFSKPVDRSEVEKALRGAQSAPVRGQMYWVDDLTLIWQVAALPSRLDFLLGGAHDQDGLPLPGGVPSVRVGSPPVLVEVNLADPVDLIRATLPPDVISAGLVSGQGHINLTAWSPGTTRWDWGTVDFSLNTQDWTLKSGHVAGVQPRLPGDLQFWRMNPQGTMVAGLRPRPGNGGTDLVLMDLRAGRQQVLPGFLGRSPTGSAADATPYLAWSADGSQIAALTPSDDPAQADLIILGVADGRRAPALRALAVPAQGSRVEWSASSRFILAGNLLIDLESKQSMGLPGLPNEVRGTWEPGGSGRLLYQESEWGTLWILDPLTGTPTPLGTGMIVDWTAPERVYVVRWPSSQGGYVPPGF